MSTRRPMTRGPLPPEVYWRRRFFVVALAVTLVFVIGSMLSGGTDGRDADAPVARQAGAVDASQTVTVGHDAGRKGKKGKRGKNGKNSRNQPGPTLGPTGPVTDFAEPDGPCKPSDITVTPQVSDAVAGRDVTIGLRLQTINSEACTWTVSKKTVAVKILDGTYEVWTSRECPKAIPTEPVVVRRAIATVVEMTWIDARESDPSCSRKSDWVLPGDFTAVAAALGGEPAQATFDLVKPTSETVTEEPEKKRGGKSKKSQKDTDEKKSDEKKTADPRR